MTRIRATAGHGCADARPAESRQGVPAVVDRPREERHPVRGRGEDGAGDGRGARGEPRDECECEEALRRASRRDRIGAHERRRSSRRGQDDERQDERQERRPARGRRRAPPARWTGGRRSSAWRGRACGRCARIPAARGRSRAARRARSRPVPDDPDITARPPSLGRPGSRRGAASGRRGGHGHQRREARGDRRRGASAGQAGKLRERRLDELHLGAVRREVAGAQRVLREGEVDVRVRQQGRSRRPGAVRCSVRGVGRGVGDPPGAGDVPGDGETPGDGDAEGSLAMTFSSAPWSVSAHSTVVEVATTIFLNSGRPWWWTEGRWAQGRRRVPNGTTMRLPRMTLLPPGPRA